MPIEVVHVRAPAGTVPFKAGSILALYDDIRTAPLDFPASPPISMHLQDLLQRILEKDPADRIDMRGIMAHPWVNPPGMTRLTSLQVCAAVLKHAVWHRVKGILSNGWLAGAWHLWRSMRTLL